MAPITIARDAPHHLRPRKTRVATGSDGIERQRNRPRETRAAASSSAAARPHGSRANYTEEELA